MKLIPLYLQLLVALTYSQSICRKVDRQVRYYIYNTTVHIRTYCMMEDSANCEMRGGIVIQYEEFEKTGIEIKGALPSDSYCFMIAWVNLANDTVLFSRSVQCDYHKGNCYNPYYSCTIYWKNVTFSDLRLVHEDNFDVSSVGQSEFIHNERNSLRLNQTQLLGGVNVRTTEFDDIIASTNQLESNFEQSPLRIESNQYMNCKLDRVEKNVTDFKPAVHYNSYLYVYQYSLDVTVYFCYTTISDCTVVGLESSDDSLLHQCADHFCGYGRCTQYRTVCKKTMLVDLENDQVFGLSTKCPYNSGVCEASRAFWKFVDKCDAILPNVVIMTKNNLTLVREGSLCGEPVWYTDQLGFVVSDSVCFQMSKMENLKNEVVVLLYVVLVFVTFCVVWYVCNVIINFLLLWTIYKGRNVKSKLFLLNCVSQGLTARCLRKYQEDLDKSQINLYDYARTDI